jgi:hypothetical protein
LSFDPAAALGFPSVVGIALGDALEMGVITSAILIISAKRLIYPAKGPTAPLNTEIVGTLPKIRRPRSEAIARALGDGGIEFQRENTVGGLGVRLRRR